MRRNRCSFICLLLGSILLPSIAQARRYPIVASDSSGTWVGLKSGLLHGVGELWKRYGKKEGLPSREVTDIELQSRSVWVGTPAGLARMDKGTRRWETFAAPLLPGNQVTAISADPSDPDQVWIGVQGGVVQYNIRTNQWLKLDQKSGLPSPRVNDVLFRGKTVWAATDAGLAAYDLKLRRWTIYASQDGLAGDRVLEIDEQGQDLWLTCDQGLTRMSLQRRTFASFRQREGLPGTQLLSMVRVQNLIYLVTDGGLITYDVSADALAPFLHAQGLRGAKVTSVAAAGGFVWFTTDHGLARFDPAKKVWEHYQVEDGLSTDELQQITVSGNLLLLFGTQRELDSYDYKKDEWMDRASLLASEVDEGHEGDEPTSQPAGTGGQGTQPLKPEDQPLKLSVSAELNTELKQDFRWPRQGPSTREGYWLVNTLRLGTGAQWGGRTVDFSGNLDWGDLSPLFDGEASTLKSFQRYDLQLRYLGADRDWLKEVILSDKLRLEPDAGLLVGRTELEGGRVVTGFGPKRAGGRLVNVQAAAGVRRGTPLRVVLRRPTVSELQIKRYQLFKQTADGERSNVRYIIPSSVRVLLDGRELERNVDYFIDHENGVLWIKNTDLINPSRVLEAEFEYEQIPRKNVGATSMTDLLPRDGDIGNIKRSGQARWAKDEQGLFDEIDGGAEQYINRGWVTTLAQDFEWGSAGIILRIHDMGDDKNAQSIFLAKKLADAKAVPGLEDVFLEKQTTSLSIKLVRGQFFIEISLDQASMEQEILSIAGWLVGKLAVSGATTSDALRDAMVSTNATMQLTDDAWVGMSYVGTRSIEDDEIMRRYGVERLSRDLMALSAGLSHRLSQQTTFSSQVAAAASSMAEDAQLRSSGTGLLGRAQLAHPRLTLQAEGRKYSDNYTGLGVARQTEFCRTPDLRCALPGTSRLDYEAGLAATVKGLDWLPVDLAYQRQMTRLGLDYADAPADRERLGVRDVAWGKIALDRPRWPKLFVGSGYIRREDALTAQGQIQGSSGLEMDLAEGLLRALHFKKIFLRGLYDYGRNDVDEYRTVADEERDRLETMHHVVGEARLAPTLTESGYATLEYHQLQGALSQQQEIVDRLLYWRLDAGAGSSYLPGIALRFDTTLWFGDDQPFVPLQTAAGSAVSEEERKQEANSTMTGVMDIFPGEWVKKLSPIKLNGAYTFSRQNMSQGRRQVLAGTFPLTREVCNNGVDDDGDSLVDCNDPQCALDDTCLLKTGQLLSHRVYGTVFWDTPGKLQAELFADLTKSYSGQDGVQRGSRLETRSYVTWRPIYSSPITVRFDASREEKRPEQYDAIADTVKPEVLNLEPALEWRRRWSEKWWHLAKLTVSHARTTDLPHIRTFTDAYGQTGELERLDYHETALKPSLEIRRRFEDENNAWNFRPYIRASYKLQWGSGVRSRIDTRFWDAEDPGFADGSETSRTLSVSLGFIWVHSEHVFVDLDLTASHYDCVRAPSGSVCNDTVMLVPHLLATARY